MLPVARHADNKGFTLIEVMVAMVILLIGMMALLQTVNMSIALNSSNKMRTDAVLLADERVSSERTKAFSGVVTGTTETVGKYTVLSNVSSLTSHSVASDKIAGSKRLRVVVSWSDRGKAKTHSLTTTIVEPAN